MWARISSVFRRSQPAADADEQLIDAVNRGDAAAVEAALAAGADPNCGDFGDAPLNACIEQGCIGILDVLLKHGADIDAIGANGFTALCMAAHDGDLDVARLLLDRGADVHAAHPDSGFTALHYAAEGGHVEVARLLLDRGADVGATSSEDNGDVFGITSAQPLHIAAFLKHAAAVELLLARGADVRAAASWCAAATGWQCIAGMTPLHFAVTPGHYGATEIADIPLWTLKAATNAVATVRALLDAGAPINAAASEGLRPLHLAVSFSDNNLTGVVVRGALYADGASVARLLLHRGADVAAVGPAGRTPLHVACDPPGRPVPKVVELLLHHGADARAADVDGWQPLHCLAAHQPRRKNGDSQGSTAEEYAEAESEARDVERIVEALVEHGADVGAVGAADDEGCTPMILAVAARNAPACAALARRGPLVSQCSRCVAAAKLSADAQAAVVGMAGEAAQLRRQQAALEEERAALEQERAAWQRERAALARERAAWRKERAAIEAARGSGGGGGGGGGGADQQQEEEGQPAAKRKRGSAGAARRRR